ncbi:hypothetical protein ACXYTJ_04135 [Gilvimarinus sp. F26214L]|uniref:hypothetical protein n=1 Tax=Gilvimarinus sp. DZF01 TaxID=3461371 RepID=UPI00404674E8
MLSLIPTDDPEAELDRQLAGFGRGGKLQDAFTLDYTLVQDYLPGAPAVSLLAFIALRRSSEGVELAFSIARKSDELLRGLNCLRAEWEAVRQWCEDQNLPWLRLDSALKLEPIHIAKPWGQEVWFTGIEARGQSRVADPRGRTLPLPWLLSLCPARLMANNSGLILLKILDPLPVPVYGDLYFEMHEEKREVYVVTHVDRNAWPGGEGGIRFGFDQAKRADFRDEAHFKQAYLAAVTAYREVRVAIDDLLDERRRSEGIPLDAPVETAVLREWMTALPESLLQREATLRQEMEGFIHVAPLRVGDVVKVPCFTPHSLLHGVRTVEFQTPVYERKILSFAQKVLTQPHWDTAAALQKISLDPPEPATLPEVFRDEALRVEEVVNFEDFRVERLSVRAGREYVVDAGEDYLLLMGVSGSFQLVQSPATTHIAPEQAVLLPRAQRARLCCDAASDGIVLVAKPRT